MTIIAEELDRLETEFHWKSPLVGPDEFKVYATQGGHQESAYDSDQVEILEVGESGWWYSTRSKVLAKSLKRFPLQGALWDVGSGSGIVGDQLSSYGIRSVCIEPSVRGARLSATRGNSSICGTLQDLLLPDGSVAGVGLFDVLEHLEDRIGMLQEAHRVLKHGGRVYLTLPALQSLWSQMDEDAGHQLRYSRRSIRKELQRAGFIVERNRYFFLLSLPVVILIRVIPYRLGIREIVGTDQLLAREIGWFGKIAAGLEILWSKVGLVGSSLLVVARKP